MAPAITIHQNVSATRRRIRSNVQRLSFSSIPAFYLANSVRSRKANQRRGGVGMGSRCSALLRMVRRTRASLYRQANSQRVSAIIAMLV
jgi:hypothetical protein